MVAGLVMLQGLTGVAVGLITRTPWQVIGSLRYLSPEQIEGQRMSARTDVYQWGLTVYEMIEGWSESTRGARSWAQLPATAIKYIRRVEELIQAPVALLSTSPERDDTILVTNPFAD